MNYCSFCGKRQEEVFKLVAGPNDVTICDECIVECQRVVDGEKKVRMAHSLVHNLPDHAVLSKTQTCVLTNLSADTLNRLHQRGEGPSRVQLSSRRVGYKVGAVLEWIEKRTSP